MEKIKWEKPDRLKQPAHFGLRHIKSKIAKKSSQTQRVLMSVYWLCFMFFTSFNFRFWLSNMLVFGRSGIGYIVCIM